MLAQLDPKTKLFLLCGLVIMLTLLGMLVISRLRVTWSRHLTRQRELEENDREATDEPMTDVWQEAAHRINDVDDIEIAAESDDLDEPFQRKSPDDETDSFGGWADDPDDEPDDDFWRGGDDDKA